jgi:hypothetical protein
MSSEEPHEYVEIVLAIISSGVLTAVKHPILNDRYCSLNASMFISPAEI